MKTFHKLIDKKKTKPEEIMIDSNQKKTKLLLDNYKNRFMQKNQFFMILSNSLNYPLASAFFINFLNNSKEMNCFIIRSHLMNFVENYLQDP